MKHLRTTGDNQLATQRANARDAAREQRTLDAVSVLYAIKVKLDNGDVEAARRMAADWRASQVQR
jgi:hypothetical protein